MPGPSKQPKLRIYFSDFFNVSSEELKGHGAFDISLINDLPLFIDPFLLFNSEKQDYQDLHNKIIEYVKFLKSQSGKNLSKQSIKNLFYFPEVKQNWLGYSKTGNNGRGLGEQFAHSLRKDLITRFKSFGEESEYEEGQHIEKLLLVKKGVGKDQISDLTCNLILGYLANYTESFAKKYIDPGKLELVTLERVEFNQLTQTWNSKEFLLPKYRKQFVLLSPIDILTKDETWINYKELKSDFKSIKNSLPNEILRKKINDYFSSILKEDASKKETEEAIEKVLEKFPQILDWYIAGKVKNKKEASELSTKKISDTNELFIKQLVALVELLDKTDFYKTDVNSYAERMHRIMDLKKVIEEQDGHQFFYLKGKSITTEPELQLMFRLIWFAYNPKENDEEDSDSIVSFDKKYKTSVDFKLASNNQLAVILKEQLTTAKATRPIRVILYFSDNELTRVQNLLTKYKLNPTTDDIVFIDARWE